MSVSVLEKVVETAGIWKQGELFAAHSSLLNGYIYCELAEKTGLPLFAQEADVYRFCEMPNFCSLRGLDAFPVTLEGAKEIAQRNHPKLQYIFLFAKGRPDELKDLIELGP